MTDVLSPRGRAELAAFLARGPLLAFDFDGTLAAIVSRPEAARLRPAVKARLRRLALRRPCALVTGRALGDVRPRIAGIRWHAVVGNHGMEAVPPLRNMGPLRRRVRRWLPTLQRLAARHPGVVVEDKRYSYSVHFRHAPRPAATGRALGAALRRLPGARVVPGKCVFNVLPAGAVDKGEALRRLCARRGAAARAGALFVGDDVTDEDAFAALPAARSFGIVVGKRNSRARYFLRRQSDVTRLLSLILAEERVIPAP